MFIRALNIEVRTLKNIAIIVIGLELRLRSGIAVVMPEFFIAVRIRAMSTHIITVAVAHESKILRGFHFSRDFLKTSSSIQQFIPV
jgi:hypothetical protein